MPIECRQTSQGGKGNRGMFIERDPNIVAAGLPTAQQNNSVGEALQHYLLKDEVDALISDAIIPPSKERTRPPLRRPTPIDLRHSGPDGSLVSKIIRPEEKSKFENLVQEFKETSYQSYWKTAVGEVKDPTPMLPEGFNIYGTTFGKATPFHGRLYDIVMPKVPHPDKTPPSKGLCVQVDRKYCTPAYNPELTYGHRTFVDKRGTYARCCLSDDKITLGSGGRAIVSSIQSDFVNANKPGIGLVTAPNNNISEVPQGYAFGILKPPDNVPECLTFCKINKGVEFLRKCLKHLNTIRRALSKRRLPTFFYNFYLTLKFHDTEHCGWLSKDIVYKQCGIELIRFDPELLEPLLTLWHAFDGIKIEYQTFVRVINYRIPSPEIPKIPDFLPECLDFRTTYTEMVKSGQTPDDRKMAGLPSGRYLDLDYLISPERCCKADQISLPQESDVRSCIAPSILTRVFVSHRDMFEKRSLETIRRVFEASGENFTDDTFNEIWSQAQMLHSQGWVCYETFRKALETYSMDK